MKLSQIVILAGALTSALFFSGCATVVRGGSEKVTFQSTPSGAEVRLSTGQAGVTPCEIEVKRKGDISVTLHKDGYKEFTTTMVSSIDGASVGIGTAANLVFLPIINDVVDYKTGANYSHKPNPLIVNLIPLSSPEKASETHAAAPSAETSTKDAGEAKAQSTPPSAPGGK